jgi:hypothetical protein
MNEARPEKFDNLSLEDKERMERLVQEAEGILFADELGRRIAEEAKEELRTEETLGKGKEILSQEAGEEIAFTEREFGNIFGNPQYVKEMFLTFEKKFSWPESKSRAMVGVLRHALNELYYRSRFRTADEFNPHPESQTRDTRELLFNIVADDYGAEVMREVSPLIELYTEKAWELIQRQKKEQK